MSVFHINFALYICIEFNGNIVWNVLYLVILSPVIF